MIRSYGSCEEFVAFRGVCVALGATTEVEKLSTATTRYTNSANFSRKERIYGSVVFMGIAPMGISRRFG